MKRDIEHFIKLVFPTSILGDYNLTPLERLLLIYILSLCKNMDIVGLLMIFLVIDLMLVSKQYQRV